MTCDEFESRILAGQEDQLSADERADGEKHLAGCASCQALARQLRQLDAALMNQVNAPKLAADFSAKLRLRVQAATPLLSEAQRAERKRQLQAEYETGLAQFNHRLLSVGALLDGLGYVALVALAGGLAWLFLPRLTMLLAGQGLSGSSQNLLPAVAAGAVFLAIGLTAAFPRQLRQFWAAI